MPERDKLRKKIAGKARAVAGTLGEGVKNIKTRAAEAKRERKQTTDQEEAHLERARPEPLRS